MDAAQIVAVSIGGFLVLLLLALVFWRRNLTAAEYTFARIVLALAAACVAVVLTGFLKVDYEGFIQAGGAFAVFVIVFMFQPAALQGSQDWIDLRSEWRGLRDLGDDVTNANADDVVHALNAVNSAAKHIGSDDSLFRPFSADFGEDYCTLYRKLKKGYPVAHKSTTSETLLTLEADRLAKRLGCGQ